MENSNKGKKWTYEEDVKLMEYIMASPHNLKRCFACVSDVLGRTPLACSQRWYSYVSMHPEKYGTATFTASSQHLARNRKNSMGVTITGSIWRRLLNIIRNL